MSAAMDELLAILDLEQLEHNLFRGRSPRSTGSACSAARSSPRRWSPPSERSSPTATCIRCTAISCGRAIPRCRSSTRSTASATAAPSPRGAWSRSSTARRSFRWRRRSRSTKRPRTPGADATRRAAAGTLAQRSASCWASSAMPCPKASGATGSATGRSRCSRSMLEHYTSREKLAPRAEHLDPHHRAGAGRPRHCRRRCSPICPT